MNKNHVSQLIDNWPLYCIFPRMAPLDLVAYVLKEFGIDCGDKKNKLCKNCYLYETWRSIMPIISVMIYCKDANIFVNFLDNVEEGFYSICNKQDIINFYHYIQIELDARLSD